MSNWLKTKELFDCRTSYLDPLFNSSEYPWEIIPNIKEYIKELIKNGFEIIGVYGDLDGTPASDEDMRHIYVARNVLPRKRYEAPME